MYVSVAHRSTTAGFVRRRSRARPSIARCRHSLYNCNFGKESSLEYGGRSMRLSKGMRFLLAMAVGLALFCSVAAGVAMGARPADLVQARLLADVDSVQPGKPFKLAVLLTIKPLWHVYWENPGDSGMETRVQGKLTSGVQA